MGIPHGPKSKQDMSQKSGLKAAEPVLPMLPLDSLARRREALGAEIRARREGLLVLVVELRHLDEAIRRAAQSPETALSETDLASHSISGAGGISHLVIDVFRDAPQALSSRDIARRMADKLGLDPGNRAVMKYLTQRVCTCLWTLRQGGSVSKPVKTRGSLQLWECAPASGPDAAGG